MNSTDARPVLLTMRRFYFEQFAAGIKQVEYRLHKPPFTKKVYYVGRWVRICYNYNIKRYPTLLAQVTAFDVAAASRYPAVKGVYPDVKPDDELALITLRLHK